MAKVIIDDSSLNDIANALRTKNGLVRTYRPSEMPAAIRALKEAVPSTHGYSVRIEQSPHQTIYVDLYQDNQSHGYQQSFTVGEPYWKFQARVEAEAGYIAGTLNYNGTFTINRDYLIQASPATYRGEDVTTVYMNGTFSGANAFHGDYYVMYSDRACTTSVSRGSLYGIVNVVDVSNGLPYNGNGLFGGGSDTPIFSSATEIRQNINVSEKRTLRQCFYRCGYLRKVDLSNWHPVNLEDMYQFAQGSDLQYLGDISNWYMPELIRASCAFRDASRLESLDLHNWYCPKLETTEQMFYGCTKLRYVDISGLSTQVNEISDFVTSYEMFRDCSSLQYIIMDRPEIMFASSGTLFANPHTRVKYLVPQDQVDAYKHHANWSSRASQIDAIENYTIDRHNGQVFVSATV